MNITNKKPLVSVCMLSYNHEKYIRQSLDSVLMQKVNFDYEIVVGEDCSTDNTRNILLEYSAKYKDLFKLLLQKKNVGSVQNYIDALNACTGKYLAYLETDDYWTDEFKLQKQIDFLEDNMEFGMVHTRANIVDETNNLLFISKDNQPSGDVFDYLIFINSFIINCSICLRRRIIEPFLEKIKQNNLKYVIDYYLWIYAALYSKIYFLNDITAVHRSHPGGITKKNTELHKSSMPYIITDIIIERFLLSKDKKLTISKRYIYGITYSKALFYNGMKMKDKIKRLSFFLKEVYLIPAIFISLVSKIYLKMKHNFKFKINFWKI